MTRTLLRNCVGCGRSVRGRTRCIDCERDYQRAKRARRPDLYNDAAERRRRQYAVADHRALVGDWCPGWANQPAHQSADLTADHVKEVARGAAPMAGWSFAAGPATPPGRPISRVVPWLRWPVPPYAQVNRPRARRS